MITRLERLLFHLPSPLINHHVRCQIMRKWGAKIGSEVFISRLTEFRNASNIEIGNDTVISECTLQAWASIYIGITSSLVRT